MRLAGLGVFSSSAAVVVAVSFANGGYFRESWLWIALALCSLAGMVILLREPIVLSKLDLLALAALVVFETWTALSAAWSSAPTQSLHDAERGLVYVAALLAFLLLVESATIHDLLGGVAAGAVLVCGYSLGERLLATSKISTDVVSGTRLNEPLGYTNALGILAAIGVLLSLGLAVHARNRVERALWASATPLLLAALALTESRGAVVALAAGLGVLVVVEARRAELVAAALVLSASGAAALLSTLRATSLRSANATPGQLSSAGARLTLALLVLMLASSLASLAIGPLAARLRRQRLSWMVPAVFALALTCAAAVGVLGVDRALGPRVDYWRVAWHEFVQNPWLGSGAATFFQYSLRAGMPVAVLDAHSLFLETLAELGVLGLLLLAAALVVPLVAAVREHEHSLASVSLGAYVAFLVHAGLDWDWEMPAVTLTGLLVAVGLLVAARVDRDTIAIGLTARIGVASAALSVAVIALALRLLVD